MKKKIVIGCSVRFRNIIRKAMEELSGLGFEPIFPNLDISKDNIDVARTAREKLKMAKEHYAQIKTADAVYFILPNGYLGTSCKIELGYAFALGKPIYFSEPANSIDLDGYPKKIIPTEKLALFKKEF